MNTAERRHRLGLDQPLVTTGPGGDYQRHVYPSDVDLIPRGSAIVGTVVVSAVVFVVGVGLGAFIF